MAAGKAGGAAARSLGAQGQQALSVPWSRTGQEEGCSSQPTYQYSGTSILKSVQRVKLQRVKTMLEKILKSL